MHDPTKRLRHTRSAESGRRRTTSVPMRPDELYPTPILFLISRDRGALLATLSLKRWRKSCTRGALKSY